MKSNKIVLMKREDAQKMNSCQLIFFMFYDKYKNNESPVFLKLTDIAVAVAEHHKLDHTMTEGTVSKSMETLKKSIIFKDEQFTIRKTYIDPQEKSHKTKKYYLFPITKPSIALWKEGKNEFSENEYLVDKKICKVSDYMYIYKLNMYGKEGRKLSADRIKKRIIIVKDLFAQMIHPDHLFDVSHSDGNIVVMLNSDPERGVGKYFKQLRELFVEDK